MKKLQLKLTKHISKKDFSFLNHDLKIGETFYLNSEDKKCSVNAEGILSVMDENLKIHKIPAGVLSVSENGKDYTIFLTESSEAVGELFAIEQPFNHLELLTQIQHPNEKTNLSNKQVLKTEIKNSTIYQTYIKLNEIHPLF